MKQDKFKKTTNPVAKAMMTSREVNVRPKVVASKKRYKRENKTKWISKES